MNEQLDALVSSLLYEGYALYPYTPGATKNATPTPFGIVYPPAYAALNGATHDNLRLECVLAAPSEAEVSATVRFLQASGERHKGLERRVELPATALSDLLGEGVETEFALEGERSLSGRARLEAEAVGDDGVLSIVRCTVLNTTELAPGEAEELARPAALIASLLSTHAVIETSAGRFVSPLERDGAEGAAVERASCANTFPVLASPADDAVLGAAIVLPDHPQIAPQSLGNLFDNTEIEEALVLHVQALSDSEREAIADQDPAVREMIERAAAASAEDVFSLHGLMQPTNPGDPLAPLEPLAAPEVPQWSEPGMPMPPDPGPDAEPGHPNPGEQTLELEGQTFRKGGKVVLRPGTERDVLDRMLDGRTATIERLYLDYEDGAHIAVTVDDDPAQELFRETGRYLFFKAGEIEAVDS